MIWSGYIGSSGYYGFNATGRSRPTTVINYEYSHYLRIDPDGSIVPQGNNIKLAGFPIRCLAQLNP